MSFPFLNMSRAECVGPAVQTRTPPPPPKRRKLTPPAEPLTAEAFVARLAITQERADVIERYEQRSEEWLEARKGRITASNFGSAVGRNKYSTPTALVKNMLWATFKGNICTRWGTEHESDGEDCYAASKHMDILDNPDETILAAMSEAERDVIVTALRVEEAGLVINPERPWMGNSPDGLIHVTYASGRLETGLLEIKCPYGKKFYPDTVPPQYMAQIQGTMGNLGLPWCDFVVWTPQETQITRVPFDPEYWNGMLLPKLTEFYFNRYVPAAVNKENGLLEEGEIEVAIELDMST
jgi:hypothetical protein